MNFTQTSTTPPTPPTVPSGWQAHWDDSSRAYYYHATSSGTVQWERPTSPPAGLSTPIAPPPQSPRKRKAQHEVGDPAPTTVSAPTTTTTTTTTTTKKHENPEEYDAARYILIADRSGSMRSFGDETMGALKAYVDGISSKTAEAQEAQDEGSSPETPPLLTLITFDREIDVVARNVSTTELVIQPAWITPRGSTALRDALALGVSIADEEEKKLKLQGKTCEVFVAIFTDGSDNASQKYSPKAISELIQVRKDRGWDFTFLAANQNAVTSAQSLNIAGKDAITVGKSRGGMKMAMKSASRKCKRSGFTPQNRMSAMTGKN